MERRLEKSLSGNQWGRSSVKRDSASTSDLATRKYGCITNLLKKITASFNGNDTITGLRDHMREGRRGFWKTDTEYKKGQESHATIIVKIQYVLYVFAPSTFNSEMLFKLLL